MASDMNLQLLAARALNAAPDNVVSQASGGRQAEQRVLSYGGTRHHLADEGTYYAGSLTPAGTSLTFFGNIGVFSKTTMSIIFQNRAKAHGTSRIYFDYFRISWLAASASGTSVWCMFASDNLNMPTNADINLGIAPRALPTNLDSNFDNPMFVYFSSGNSLGTTAATSAWAAVTSRLQLKNANYAAGDEHVVVFGSRGAKGSLHSSAGRSVAFAGPVAIGPQTQLELHLVVPGGGVQGACEVDYGFWLR